MSRSCTICNHSNSPRINEKLISGQPYRSIAKHFEISESALYRHKNHISTTLRKAKHAKEVSNAGDLLEQVTSLHQKALGILEKAEDVNDWKIALGAIREARGNLELLAKLLGELKDNPQVNILISPEWMMLRTVILQAIEPYPEARTSMSKALEKIKNGSIS